MGRPLRCTHADRYAHVCFHTIDVFFTPKELKAFVDKLKVLVERHDLTILAWTFMNNHCHLFMEFSEDENCGTIVGTIESCLTKVFNKIHQIKGPLWLGRYKDVTVSEETHLWACLSYIHLNKMKAGIVPCIDQDYYSSAQAYLKGKSDGITTLPEVYNELGDTPEERQRTFREFIDDAWERFKDKQTWQRIADGETVTAGKGRIDLAEVMKISDRHDEILRRSLVKARPRASRLVKAARQAMDQARQRIQRQRDLLAEELHKQGISAWVLDHFFAEREFISDFVQDHRSQFRYSKQNPYPVR